MYPDLGGSAPYKRRAADNLTWEVSFIVACNDNTLQFESTLLLDAEDLSPPPPKLIGWVRNFVRTATPKESSRD